MAETPEQRKARHQRKKEMLKADPEAMAEFKAKHKIARKKYEGKLRRDREGNLMPESRKPGRLVAMCGWLGW